MKGTNMARKPIELTEPLTEAEKEALPRGGPETGLVILVAAIFQQHAGRDDLGAVFDRAKAFVESGTNYLGVRLY